MRSISLIVVGMLACVAAANPVHESKSNICPAVMPRCNCRGDAKCYYIEKPCPHTECVPTAPSLQCASPVCGTGCNKGYDCIYAKSSPTEEGCGTAICAPLARNILK